jgi:hypothetical protein
LIFSSSITALFPKKNQRNNIIIKKTVNEDDYLTYENPVIDEFFFKNDINFAIEEQLLETCKTFKYGSTTDRTANNDIVGENERIGNCFDYAVHFVWNWNKKYFTEMPALLIICSDTSRGYYTVYNVVENNTKHKGYFGSYDDFHYYSVEEKKKKKKKKVGNIKVPIMENHAWVIIMNQYYQIVVDPQETDHLGYSKNKFYYN